MKHITDTERKLQTQVNLLTTTNEVLAERLAAADDVLAVYAIAVRNLTAERDAQSKAADHWMTEACAEHNNCVRLEAERDALADRVKALINALRIKASMMEMGEKIAWGSDTTLMRQAADMLEAESQPKQVTCQIYGHVVGACVECNTHIESQVPEGWDEAVKSAQFFYDSGGLTMKEYAQELAQAIIDMDKLMKEVKP
jgi:hypothetical protein